MAMTRVCPPGRHEPSPAGVKMVERRPLTAASTLVHSRGSGSEAAVGGIMGIDFSRFEQAGPSDRQPRHPRDVFAALPRRRGYEYLRGPQDQILDQWSVRRGERDLVVKLNTGGGKTVVGLLIAQCSLEEGEGPVAYLVPDHYLAEQVRTEAAALGINVAADADSYEFRAKRAILVDVFQKLVNGQSVFGVGGSSPKVPRFELGTVVIDDAHTCIARAEEVFRLQIPADSPAHDRLLELFRGTLEQQSQNGMLDLAAGRRSALLQVPYWAWQDRQREVVEIVHPITDVAPYCFSWPLIVDVLPWCRTVFTAEGVEIAPDHLPIDVVTGFAQARRRVYLTATLADDGVLVKDFNADPATIVSPVAPANAGDIGDRLILLPAEVVPDAAADEVRGLVAEIAQQRNVVVIVPSKPRAEVWKQLGAEVLDRDSIKAGIERLRANPRLGLMVLVNRYDGVDLPDDACHVLVVDGLPEALGGLDRLDEAQLTGSIALLRRQIQRIEQGMGRAVRSNDDHCVVLLLGSRLTERLLRAGAEEALSPATRAQMQLSREVATAIRGKGFKELRAVVDQVLERDKGWLAASRSRLSTLRYTTLSVDQVTIARRAAFDAAASGRPNEAPEKLQSALTSANADKVLRGQLLQELAMYEHSVDPIAAQLTQRGANESNRALLRPATGVSYAKLGTPTQEQGAAASSWLQGRYSSGGELRLGFNALLSDLTWGPRAEQFEAAMQDLAFHLGFAGQRPEREIGRGPDNLWALNDGSFLVIEDKSGAREHPVYKDDAKQLSNSMDWFKEQYALATGTPVLVHPWATFDSKAAMPQRCRVITLESLTKVRDSLAKLATALAQDDTFRDPARTAQLLDHFGFTAQHFLHRHSVDGRSGR